MFGSNDGINVVLTLDAVVKAGSRQLVSGEKVQYPDNICFLIGDVI